MSNQRYFPLLKHIPDVFHGYICNIDNLYAGKIKGPQKATGTTLKYHCSYIDQLPEKFRVKEGFGYQYLKCNTLDEAEQLCQELRQFIFTKWPDSIEWASTGWYRWLNYDMQELQLEFID